MSATRRTAFVLCLIVLFGYEAYVLFVQESGAAAHVPLARERNLTREVNAETPLSQTFVMHAEGFTGVEIYARKSDRAAVGPLEVTVSRVVGDFLTPASTVEPTPVARESLDVARLDVSANGSVLIDVPRVSPSAGTAFRLDIAMPNAPRGHGLRFEAGGPTYIEGVMVIGGRQEWGDLKFRTLAERTTVSSNLQPLQQSWPAPLRNGVVWIVVLLIGNGALATAIYYLVFAPDAPDGPGALKGSELTTADQPRV